MHRCKLKHGVALDCTSARMRQIGHFVCPCKLLTPTGHAYVLQVPVSQQSLFIRTPGDPVPLDITHEEDVQTLGGLGFQVGNCNC